MRLHHNVVVVSICGLTGCAAMAVATAPVKQPSPPSAAGKAAADAFWSVLHEGRFADIDGVLEQHMRVTVKEPRDALTLAHAGWLHAWKLAESSRAPGEARVIERASLARRYFEEAVQMVPGEARYLGFLASFTMAEGNILENEREVRAGYYLMKDAVAAWPEFNLFTSGYTVSTLPTDSPQFREGLEQQWLTIEQCFNAGRPVSRQAPDLAPLLAVEDLKGPKRACWNSWIAPHNLEGFFLNFGDMLVRASDLDNAKVMYAAARLSKGYAQWPYRAVLERRLAELPTLGKAFATATREERELTPMFNSAFSCMGCHQETGAPSVP